MPTPRELRIHNVVFVLTVPHYTCDARVSGHLCDVAAGMAARALHDQLQRLGAEVEGPYMGTVPRTVSDLNRSESRETKWRKELSARIRMLRGRSKDVFVVDVHSYDRDAPWSMRRKRIGEKPPQLVFLDGNDEVFSSGAPLLLRELLPPELQVLTEVGGSHVNDIVATAPDDGATWAILIEFDEDSNADRRWLPRTTGALAQALIAFAGTHDLVP